MRSGLAPSAVSLAVCMATQMWQPFRVATVMITTSRATGSSVHRSGDEADRRRKLARLTPRGIEALAMSAMIFNDIRSRWQATLGDARLSDLEAALRTMVPGETFRLDVPGWFGA